MTGIPWRNDIQYVKNIGPRRAALLKKLGINSLGDLLYLFPREYRDLNQLKNFYSLRHGDLATVRATVSAWDEVRPRKGLTLTRALMNDGLSNFMAVWFNQSHIKRQLSLGTVLLVSGKVNKSFSTPQLQVSEYEVEDGSELLNTGRIVPVYPLTEGLSQRVMRIILKSVLDQWLPGAKEFLPEAMLQKYLLPHLGESLSQVHYPESARHCHMARRRFIFEELFLQQLVTALQRHKVEEKLKPHRYLDKNILEEAFIKNLPFKLTPGQENAWLEIKTDMGRPNPANRLLQGDVGSGKTVLCVLALLRAVGSGLQGAVMAPTEILAQQHYNNFRKHLEPIGVRVGILKGSMGKKERSALLEGISLGSIELVVGTHALIQEDVKFKALAVVVVDEQHRFGVRQRALLAHKGSQPDILVMTATPIPRTLSLTLYGDLNITTIKGLPPGRRPVDTFLFKQAQFQNIMSHIKKEARQGRQSYIICPLVEESLKIDLQAATDLASGLSQEDLKDFNVGLVHGRMKGKEKEAIMEAFRAGAIDVLVSTTVVEVGVDVPNATTMVIIDAHRFGLAQLHQLRGRVGRGKEKSYCFLVSDNMGPDTRARLEAMVSTGDGFLLAEKDLSLRGPGEVWGTRQWGMVQYKIADPIRDIKAMEVARQEAAAIIAADPRLESPQNQVLLKTIMERFDHNLISSVIS